MYKEADPSTNTCHHRTGPRRPSSAITISPATLSLSISLQPLARRHTTAYVAALSHLIHQGKKSNGVIDPTSGQALEYRHLIRGPNSYTWIKALANNLGRLAQGVGTRMPTGTNNILFVAKSDIPHVRKVTYTPMVASIRPKKAEVNRVQVTVGGYRLDLPGATTTHCTSLTTTKCLLNSTISTPGARFMTLDIKDFYFGTALARY